MVLPNPNEYIEEIITGHLRDNAVPGLIKIDLQISTGTGDEIFIDKVDTFQITRNFEDSAMDFIALSLTLLPNDAIKIIKSYKDLRANITIWLADYPYAYVNESFPPDMYQYKALLSNPADLFKKVESGEIMNIDENKPPSERQNSTKVPLSMQLMTDTDYANRHKPLNSNLKDVTLEDTLHFIANALGFKECKIAKPDNSKTYDNIPIPPMIEYRTGFQLIQDRYGAYNKGLGYYANDDTLYIYQKYDNDPQEPPMPGILNLYKLGTGAYSGLDTYTAQIGSDFHCLINEPIHMQDISEKSTEYTGNSVLMTRSQTSVDIHKKQTGDNKYEQNPLKTIAINATNENTASENMQYTKYITAQDNVYKQMEQLSKNNCAICMIPISYFDVFKLFPGMKVILHYNEKETYKTLNGMLMAAAGSLAYEQRGGEHVYKFFAKVVARFVPDKKVPDSVTA